tara:strand:- start:601 stop:744 length:144 start_codon:yes stop_codon:yes gene_type:complete
MDKTAEAEQFLPVFKGSLDSAKKAAWHLSAAGVPNEIGIAPNCHPDS